MYLGVNADQRKQNLGDPGNRIQLIISNHPLRFDFESFEISDPVLGTAASSGAKTTNGGAIGDCKTDQFSIDGVNGRGSPVICGTNTGQHSKKNKFFVVVLVLPQTIEVKEQAETSIM